jgi:chemotaxis methyl-accepting protein methylase
MRINKINQPKSQVIRKLNNSLNKQKDQKVKNRLHIKIHKIKNQAFIKYLDLLQIWNRKKDQKLIHLQLLYKKNDFPLIYF